MRKEMANSSKLLFQLLIHMWLTMIMLRLKEVDDHETSEIGFIGDIFESDDDLTDNERNNVNVDEHHGKAYVGIIEDAGRCNDIFTEIERNYAHTVSGFNVKILHIHGDVQEMFVL
ncbi:hypothetical protein GJ496_001277 [Pomphorhynchus laevis]|nr:hypothetical protein GJ496_001277 [Pomphorhynchus laevis]